MNPYVQKATHSSHNPGMKHPPKIINDPKAEKGKFNQNRRIGPSRTPDRLHYNDYSINKTPSIKRITNRVVQQGFQQYNGIVPPIRMPHADKNRFSEKKLTDKSYDNIMYAENGKYDRSYSNPRPKKRTNSNNAKITESALGRDSRHLQTIPYNRLQNLSTMEKEIPNSVSNGHTLKVPPIDSVYHSSLQNSTQHTRNHSLTQVNVNTTISPTDMVSTTFVTSVGSGGGGGGASTFLTEQTLENDSRVNMDAINKPRIVLRPLLEARQDQKLQKAYQMPKNYLLGAIPSSSQKFAGYRRNRMQYQSSKDRNLSLSSKNNQSYHLSNSRSKENHKQIDTSGDHDLVLDNTQITNRTVKSEKKMLSKRNSFTNMSLLDAMRPTFESNRANNSFSIDEAFDRLNELTLKNRSARNDLLKIQQSVVEMRVQNLTLNPQKRKIKAELSSRQLSNERSQPEL